MAKGIKAEAARAAARENSGRKRRHSHADQANAVGPLEVLDDAPMTAPTAKQLTSVANAARDQVKLVRAIEKKAKELKDLERDLNKNRMEILPAAMKAVRMTDFELAGGYGVKVKTVVFANVPQPDSKADNAEERHKIGIAKAEEVCPDLVQHSIVFYFQKGEEESLFRKFIADLGKRKTKPEYVIRDTINGQSLAAWVRKQDEAAATVPEKEFNVHRITVAEVKIPKKKGIV